MRPVAATMANDLLVFATGIHQRIGKDWHSLEGFVFVDAASHIDDVGGSQTGVEGDGAEGVKESGRRHLRSPAVRPRGSRFALSKANGPLRRRRQMDWSGAVEDRDARSEVDY